MKTKQEVPLIRTAVLTRIESGVYVSICVMMLGALIGGFGFIIAFAKNFEAPAESSVPDASASIVTFSEFTVPGKEAAQNEFLIKLREGATVADVEQFMETSVSGETVPVDARTPSVVAALSGTMPLFREREAVKSESASEDQLSRWHTASFTGSPVDFNAVETLLRSTDLVDVVEPNTVFTTAALALVRPRTPILDPIPYPSDPFLYTSRSWGQLYPDTWPLNMISAKNAWDVLYVKRGDIYQDGKIDQQDVNLLGKYINEDLMALVSPWERGDVNGDEALDQGDIDYLTAYLAGGREPVDYSKNTVTIAVVDTGVNATHEDLQGRIWTNADEIPDNSIDDDENGFVDDVHGWDFTHCTGSRCAVEKNEDNDPRDQNGHGTHVAGTIAANLNNQKGIAGVCPHCMVMPIQGIEPTGFGFLDDLARSILYAVDNGADVISMSWIAGVESELLHDAIQYASQAGTVLVASAGNANSDAEPYIPAGYDEVITVASVDHYGVKSDFSNWGKIDVAAPGGDSIREHAGYEPSPFMGRNILSLRAAGTDMYGDGISIVKNLYYRARGTSMSSPHVSGLAGLVITRHPEFTAEQVRGAIEESAIDVMHIPYACEAYSDSATCNTSPSTSCHWGIEFHEAENSYCRQYDAFNPCEDDSKCVWFWDLTTCIGGVRQCQSWDVEYGPGVDQYTGSGIINAYRALYYHPS
ncbi:MAG: S8 family serine peptidase [Parcubacteria group bacterium]